MHLSSELQQPAPVDCRKHQRRQVAAILFGVSFVAAFYHALLITDGTLDFFHLRSYFPGAYNYYFLSLLDGRFDIPPRMIFFEGQYTEDGRAFLYYGILPALLRAPFHPFVDLETQSLAPLMVWLFAVGSGLLATDLLRVMLVQARLASPRVELVAAAVGATAIWFASPVSMLAADAAIYHEPIGAAFLLTMGFLRLAVPLAFGARVGTRRILAMALVAGLAVHARPHVAFGLYLGLCLLLVLLLVRSERPQRPRLIASSLAALLVLAAAGGAYLLTNALRFGDPLAVWGGSSGELIWGWHYFGLGTRVGRPGAEGGIGSFDPRRILPNAVTYLKGTPWPGLERFLDAPRAFFYGEVQSLLSLWLIWLLASGYALIALVGFRGRMAGIERPAMAVPPLVATGIFAGVVLSFTTRSFRYEIELWPVVFCLSILAMPRLLAAVPRLAGRSRRLLLALVVAALAVSVGASALASLWYSQYRLLLAEEYQGGTIYGITEESCLEHLEKVGARAIATPEICRR